VITVVIVAVLIIIGALTYAFVRDAITPIMSELGSTAFNNTVDQVDTNTYSGFNLLSVSVIVLAAVAILAIVLLLRAVS
jgi:hypothetical protein